MSDQYSAEAAREARELKAKFPNFTRVSVSTSNGHYLGTVEGTAYGSVRVRMDHTGKCRWIVPSTITVIEQ